MGYFLIHSLAVVAEETGYNGIVPRFITRVRLKNYKSIAACDVELEPLTFLVGVNGAGKSNFAGKNMLRRLTS